jgi:hypothetical protein
MAGTGRAANSFCVREPFFEEQQNAKPLHIDRRPGDGVGGFLGIGEKDVSVAFDQVKFSDKPIVTPTTAAVKFFQRFLWRF